jgi:hypothetical protein
MVGFCENGSIKIDNTLTFQKVIKTVVVALKCNFCNYSPSNHVNNVEFGEKCRTLASMIQTVHTCFPFLATAA